MYKVFIKYYGELVDEVSGVDGTGDCQEKYELGEEYIIESVKLLEKKIEELLQNATSNLLGNPFVIDEETDTDISKIFLALEKQNEYVIRLFNEKQENWNSYYEIVIQKCNDLENYCQIYGRNCVIDTIKKEVNNQYEKLKNTLFETKRENLICEVSLLQEIERFLDNEKTDINIELNDLKIVQDNLDYLVDELVAIYYNSELGNSYKDIEYMFREFIREFKEN